MCLCCLCFPRCACSVDIFSNILRAHVCCFYAIGQIIDQQLLYVHRFLSLCFFDWSVLVSVHIFKLFQPSNVHICVLFPHIFRFINFRKNITGLWEYLCWADKYCASSCICEVGIRDKVIGNFSHEVDGRIKVLLAKYLDDTYAIPYRTHGTIRLRSPLYKLRHFLVKRIIRGAILPHPITFQSLERLSMDAADKTLAINWVNTKHQSQMPEMDQTSVLL